MEVWAACTTSCLPPLPAAHAVVSPVDLHSHCCRNRCSLRHVHWRLPSSASCSSSRRLWPSRTSVPVCALPCEGVIAPSPCRHRRVAADVVNAGCRRPAALPTLSKSVRGLFWTPLLPSTSLPTDLFLRHAARLCTRTAWCNDACRLGVSCAWFRAAGACRRAGRRGYVEGRRSRDCVASAPLSHVCSICAPKIEVFHLLSLTRERIGPLPHLPPFQSNLQKAHIQTRSDVLHDVESWARRLRRGLRGHGTALQ
jgi:hypothetical protein